MRKQVEGNLRQFTVTEGTHYFEALAGLKRNQDGKNLARQILKFRNRPIANCVLADLPASQRSN